MSAKIQNIHEDGAERHPTRWLNANMRAIDGATMFGLTPYTSPGREAIPRVVLRILDGINIDAGQTWDKYAKVWKPSA